MHVSRTSLLGAEVGPGPAALGYAHLTWIVMHSPDLRHALQNAARHQRLVSNSEAL